MPVQSNSASKAHAPSDPKRIKIKDNTDHVILKDAMRLGQYDSTDPRTHQQMAACKVYTDVMPLQLMGCPAHSVSVFLALTFFRVISYMPHISIIVAYARNRCIGLNNTLPWRLPSDLAHFKKTTLGKPVIMGRKTWDSLGRPLPGRTNIVISRNAQLELEGAIVCGSLEQAMVQCADEEAVFIIGGQQIFTEGLAVAHEIIATEITSDVSGDTFFPVLSADEWKETERLAQPPENGLSFDFVRYQRTTDNTESNEKA